MRLETILSSFGSVHNSETPNRPWSQAAHDVLESFRDHNEPIPEEPAPPVKCLVRALNRGLQGMPELLADEQGRMSGARLYVGCPVRVVGIPERKFFIREIFWDYGEARIRMGRTSNTSFRGTALSSPRNRKANYVFRMSTRDSVMRQVMTVSRRQ